MTANCINLAHEDAAKKKIVFKVEFPRSLICTNSLLDTFRQRHIRRTLNFTHQILDTAPCKFNLSFDARHVLLVSGNYHRNLKKIKRKKGDIRFKSHSPPLLTQGVNEKGTQLYRSLQLPLLKLNLRRFHHDLIVLVEQPENVRFDVLERCSQKLNIRSDTSHLIQLRWFDYGLEKVLDGMQGDLSDTLGANVNLFAVDDALPQEIELTRLAAMNPVVLETPQRWHDEIVEVLICVRLKKNILNQHNYKLQTHLHHHDVLPSSLIGHQSLHEQVKLIAKMLILCPQRGSFSCHCRHHFQLLLGRFKRFVLQLLKLRLTGLE